LTFLGSISIIKYQIKKEEKMNTYRTHPEVKEGEVCLGFVTFSTYTKMDWKTKRLGERIESTKEEIYPVFVSEEEMRKSGVFIFGGDR
jgi:hypothetical protein